MNNKDMYSDILGLYYAALGRLLLVSELPIYSVREPSGCTFTLYIEDEMRRIQELMVKDKTNELYQCPYEAACRCRMDEPCKGCETWAKAQTAQDASYVRKTTQKKACHVMNPVKVIELNYCWFHEDVLCDRGKICNGCPKNEKLSW